MTLGFPKPTVCAFALGSILVLMGIAGCNGGGSGGQPRDAAVPPTDTGTGGSLPDAGSPADHPKAGTAQLGQTCATGTDCVSGFCADGVCCKTACSGTCETCATPGNAGTCLPADVGTDPRNDCDDQGTATCGTDGFCDGTGACEKYVAGVACQAAGCTGSTLMFAGRCDGQGSCTVKPSQSCTPFTCNTTGANTGSCKTVCTADADCAPGNSCNNGSCGLKPPGAGCAADPDCMSGHCAQGVCCATACTGTCMSCAVTKNEGTCIAVPAGQDPQGQCADQGAASCLTDGFCDGKGACELYAASTSCSADVCTAGTETAGGKCDGKGTCAPGALSACAPYVCGTTGDCKASCATNADCASGYVCNGTICGKKVNGIGCTTAAECGSGYCEQGVCCNTGCEATCQSCNLTGTVGTCSNVAAGADPLSQCKDAGAASCGTNGACDGAGACQFYPSGTVCLGQSCTDAMLTSASRCDGAGKCLAGAVSSCSPYVCGATACLTSCAGNADCASPNVCTAMSCGKYPIGAACAASSDCSSNFCAQGYCCNTACTGACQACDLAGSIGSCTNVPAGQDPLSQCTDAGAASCGSNGSCNGAGACQKYAAGTQCAAATCATATYQPASACNGTGTCAAPAGLPCAPFACDTTSKVCKTSCAADTDCAAPNICNAGTCTLAPLGHTCTGAAACASGFCAQGVCCATGCSGTCASCALTGTAGTCTNIPAGTDPLSACTDAGASTCGNDGTCDGNGKCRLYAAGTTCAAQSCSGSTYTPTRTCDGTGVCKSVTSSLCDPFACDTTNNVCKTSCAATADCASPNTCNTTTMSCGLLSQGATCAADDQCTTAHCQQGVCCQSGCAATCTSCAIAGSVGTCIAVPAGQDPLNQCDDAGAGACGLDGSCDGGGACQKYASGTQCIAASCATATGQPASTCNGIGTCITPPTVPCTPYICGPTACETSCIKDSDCISAAYMCTGGSCIKAVNIIVKLNDVNSTVQVSPHLSITNTGTSALPLAGFKLRYWYNEEATDGVTVVPTCNTPAQTAFCDYTSMAGNCDGNTGSPNFSWTFGNAGKSSANCYYEVAFSSSAGSLAAGATISEIQLRFSKNDYSPYVQTNDYSYNGASSYATTTKVTAYVTTDDGTALLVYGTEPQ